MPGRQPSNRNSAVSTRKKRQLLLFVLLTIISALLVVILALLPSMDPGRATATGDSQATDGGPRTLEPPEETKPAGDDAPTETYPENESTDPMDSPSETGQPFWWLPDPEEYAGEPGKLYLVLDDAGNSIELLPRFLDFPGPVAVAVLPQVRYSVEAAARTAAAGKEIMLHQPMEALGGSNPGPGALTVGMASEEVLAVLRDNFATVPGAIGVNNHMGSRATADRDIMETLLAEVTRRNLFFVDSRTSADTVGRETAKQLQTRFAERHVFLDNNRDRESILAAVRHALELSHGQESVLMIGHATVPELAEVLNEIYPTLIDNGYRFAPVSELPRVIGVD